MKTRNYLLNLLEDYLFIYLFKYGKVWFGAQDTGKEEGKSDTVLTSKSQSRSAIYY